MTWLRPVVWSGAATLAAMQLMFLFRSTVQVRTLPERVMEWILLFVPLDAFEEGIRTFGPQAKSFALYGSIVGMSIALFGLGVVALRRRWPGVALLGLAAALFLVVMGVIMPVTGAGFFATALLQHPLLVNGAYAAVALLYATILLIARVAEDALARPVSAGVGGGNRRALALGLAGLAGSFALALRQAATGAQASSALPLAELPPVAPAASSPVAGAEVHPGLAATPTVVTPGLLAQYTATTGAPAAAEPTPQPSPAPTEAPAAPPSVVPITAPAPTAPPAAPTVAAAVPAAQPTAPATAPPPVPTTPPPPTAAPPTVPPSPPTVVPPPLPTATADTSPIATPQPARQLERDKDGALTAAARGRGELAALVTPSGAHYVVTKNAVADPVIDADSWRLIVDGEVNRPVQLDYRTLRRLPAVEVYKTLECISNFTSMCQLAFFGCDLISTAQWKGARLRDVLDLAGGLKPGVVSFQMLGADEYSSAIPTAVATSPDVLVVYEMNGQVLPRQHGYPVRLLVPGRYGYKSAKWLVGIRALRTEHVDWYGQRNWSRTGVVKTMSRIDVPADGVQLAAGRHRIAGIAYAGDRGVGGVQFSSDGGRTWHPTVFLEPQIGRDAWVRWQGEFDLAPGQKLGLTCRAIDGLGQVQSDVFNLPQPDGGSGRHAIEVAAV